MDSQMLVRFICYIEHLIQIARGNYKSNYLVINFLKIHLIENNFLYLGFIRLGYLIRFRNHLDKSLVTQVLRQQKFQTQGVLREIDEISHETLKILELNTDKIIYFLARYSQLLQIHKVHQIKAHQTVNILRSHTYLVGIVII